LIITNACGSLNPYIPVTSIVVIDDHINLIGDNPLIGEYDPRFGVRFVDMSEPYSKQMIKLAEELALELGIKLHKGVYAAMSGPSLETRAEYRFLRLIGADLIGMSTIPECIVANQMGMKVLGFSIVTDECYPDALRPVSLDEIIKEQLRLLNRN
jgi:purine-nucleoside phosphorylase